VVTTTKDMFTPNTIYYILFLYQYLRQHLQSELLSTTNVQSLINHLEGGCSGMSQIQHPSYYVSLLNTLFRVEKNECIA